MSAMNQIMDIFLANALYYFDFDLETGIVENDIIDRNGINYTKRVGLTAPCSFDEIASRTFSQDYYEVVNVNESRDFILNCDYLKAAYARGERVVTADLYIPAEDRYHRAMHYLINDETTGSLRVFISCVDSTVDEKSRINVFGKLHNEKSEIEDIIASAQIGIWHIYLFEGEEPRLEATPKMKELMGVTDPDMSEENLYDAWYSRIKKSAIPSVNASVAEMIEKGFSENTYKWVHPSKGEVYVRCGGTATKVEGKGYILRGYHSDVTETVNSETRQKQLLADALEEVKKQKKLLQEALDDYKEADYDRRRDFLTGLRNRQDMFEMLQDVLSGKREKIQSMYMMDIDNFKLLNDHYGHTYGDECLKKIGSALNSYAIENDLYFYRYGGEEILGICFDERKDSACIAGELVKLVSDLDIKRDDMPWGVVTVSLGYTNDNQEYELMVDKADAAMYYAKEHGKNRAECYELMKR